MRIGILDSYVTLQNVGSLYNSQEIGLAKELAKRGHSVTIYKCVNRSLKRSEECINSGICYRKEPVFSVGKNAISDFSWLDSNIDALICFSDIQLCVAAVYRWAINNNIIFIPYIGITNSTSQSLFKRIFVNVCAKRAYSVYRKTECIAKTNTVKKKLELQGIKSVYVAPVGLDFELLHKNYNDSLDSIFLDLRIDPKFKYILMVGRLEKDRNPLDVVTVVEKLFKASEEYKLIIIGKGSLKELLYNCFTEKGCLDRVIWISQVKNSEIWKYYRISTAFVSFSKSEIFGMSILEAMYYELPVFVIHAPGPDDIIVDNESGFLFFSPEEMVKKISLLPNSRIGLNAHQRVVNCFSWKTMANIVESLIDKHFIK